MGLTRKLSLNDLRLMAAEFYKFIEEDKQFKEKIDSDFSEIIEINNVYNDKLEFRLVKSSRNTNSIDYIRPEFGIPIMLKINKLLNYSTIILKTDEIIPGYYMFNIDLFGNIIQNKTFKPGSLEELKLELKILFIYNLTCN